MVSPTADEIGEESSGKFKFGKIKEDEQSDLAANYNVMSFLTLIVFKNGSACKTPVGVSSKADILAMLD